MLKLVFVWPIDPNDLGYPSKHTKVINPVNANSRDDSFTLVFWNWQFETKRVKVTFSNNFS